MALKLLIIAALVSLSVAQLEVPGRLLGSSSSRSISPFAFTTTCDGTTVYTACSSCNEVLVCLGSITDQKDCKVTSPSTPYCVDGACSATPNTAECPPDALTCTGVGFYPDPTNCQVYHYCEGVDQPSSVYGCPPDYVYNAATDLCKRKIYASDCVTVKCDQSKIFASYGTSKQYFAYCQFDADGVVTSISMLKCPPYSNFDGLSCVFTCPRAGNFQHTDPAKYYQCYLSGGRLVYQVQSCSPGKVFDQDLQVCLTPPATTTTAAPAPAPPAGQ